MLLSKKPLTIFNVLLFLIQPMLFARALFAFLVLPGIVAGLIPVLIISENFQRGNGSATGFALLALGLFLLLWCVRDFFVSGKGTLAPWNPPKHLVVVGLYRYVRNPMYISVLTIVLGWSLAFCSLSLIFYFVVLAIGFHLRVVFYEEPWLQRQFEAEWNSYSALVPRWLPRLRFKKQ